MTDDESPSRRRTRQALFDAMLEELGAGNEPTIAAVAARADISRATAYRYYSDPTELVAAAMEDALARRLGAIAVPAEGSAAERAERLAGRIALTVLADEDLFRRALAPERPPDCRPIGTVGAGGARPCWSR
ncbi:TetR/AcrR family transcriptional regulator [Methylobrevis pamukkalensis]|uniref:HTH tetR-type domain-containing protein n=1 Tax=Methylobrevis pamukkalensis TaxID=1439726 RepID=A0A1E3H3H7_9HYPH|nr:TetR/AcrR family transcriptional regulator [Methylobrevis pamukkalensis]ODN70844.1 hypothetical protein A6302_01830 [Methylobrevis pamukkalensis]